MARPRLLSSRVIVALVAVILLAGCTRFDGQPEPRGTVEGMVLLGPTCPVERDPPEPGCEDRPYAAQLEAVPVGATAATARFSSDEDGTFSVPLLPGEYTIRSASHSQQPPTCSSEVFAVVADATVHVDVSCDSGIR